MARPWYTAGDLAILLCLAYDPAIAASLERVGEIGRDLATAGSVAVEETWGRLRSNSAHHVVLWVSEWPRSLAGPGFLALLRSSGIRRSFSLLYDPMRADAAARSSADVRSSSHRRRRAGTYRTDRRRSPHR